MSECVLVFFYVVSVWELENAAPLCFGCVRRVRDKRVKEKYQHG